MSQRFQSFDEFWPYYVREHSKKLTRQFHFVGTTAALGCLAAGLVTRKAWLLALAPIAGYGPAWVSHFFIEKNRPATFTYPAWSLMADFVMWGKTIAGTMDHEVESILAVVNEVDEVAESDPEIRTNMATDGTVH